MSNSKKILKTAAHNGQLKDIERLLRKFPALNHKELMSKILIEACLEGHKEVVQWVVENTEADIYFQGRVKKISAILKQEQTFSFTPLTAACLNDHLDVVNYLVETHRADVNLLDKGGYTPLTMACHRANYSVSKYFLNAVSDLNINFANNVKLNTALHYAIWCTKQDRTLLHKAYEENNVDKVCELVGIDGLDINAQDNSGFTPLHTACYYGFGGIVEILMFSHVNETITNDRNLTPAQLAKDAGRTEILELLDRESLMKALVRKKITNPVAISFLVVLTMQLLRHRKIQH